MEWTKTSEKLPEEEKRYIVFDTKFYEVRILTFNPCYNCWDGDDGDDYECETERCSHWMALPEIPELLTV